MKLEIDLSVLQPLIVVVVQEVLAQQEATQAQLGDQLAFHEPKAAALLDIERHALRDARRRCEIVASKLGSRVVYEKSALLEFLRKQREVVAAEDGVFIIKLRIPWCLEDCC